MATQPASSEKVEVPAEQLRLLEDELNLALEGNLGRLAREAGLRDEDLIEEALDNADEILAPAAQAWGELREARAEMHAIPLFMRLTDRLLGGVRGAGSYGPGALVFAMVGALVGVAAGAVGLLLTLYEGGSSSSRTVALLVIGVAVLIGAISLFLGSRGGPSRISRTMAVARFAYDSYRRELRQAGIQGWLTQRINAAIEPSYATRLTYVGRPRLAEVDDPRHEIPTEAKDRLARMLERMPGGAIGLSGSRGVGKSTLMRSLCDGAGSDQGRPVLAAMVDAPVQYDARDFILHLFAAVCTQVVGPARVQRLRGWDRPFDDGDGLLAVLRRYPRLLLGPILIAAGVALLAGPPLGGSIHLTTQGWGSVLLFLGLPLTLLMVGWDWQRIQRFREEHARPDGSADVDLAMTRLRQIWFQQSYSSGWAGSFKSPLGLEGEVSSSKELAERQMSFPEVVNLFRDFLKQIAETRDVRIGIDELDKMDDEDAHRFLNEIKVVFRIPRCFFFISVSEDAMSSFERRGLPFRDVFDSSFDDVLRIPHLGFERSKELLDRRIVGLPLPFACLLHCMSGGLPRDLIRATRNLLDQKKKTPLTEVTAALAVKALRDRVNATKVVGRRWRSQCHVAALSRCRERLVAAGDDPGDLLAACRDFDREVLGEIAALKEEDDLRAERRQAQGLAMQMAGLAYLVATMLEFFAKFDDEDYAEKAMGPGSDGKPAAVDRLASVSQVFAVDVDSGWRALSAVRGDLGLEAIDPPGLCLPALR